MIAPRLEWVLPEPIERPPAFSGFGPPVATLLARRGFVGDDDLTRFLHAGEAAMHDASLMADADRALARLDRALEAGERIAIWGDYDADGMTAVAIWVLALQAAGAEAIRYIPSRLEEGYGLSSAGINRLADGGVSLLITCDCGVGNAAEVEHAGRLGMDVVITDHHLPPGELPKAVAVVDPHRPDCAYPDPDLTGAGIAYKLATAWLTRRGVDVPDLAALAAIGTVADLAPMTGESRAIVGVGLRQLATTGRAGLRALLRRAAEEADAPTARDLGFGVAPRINAAGRIADAELALSLMLEADPVVAERLADELEEVHLRRRALTTAVVDAARQLLAQDAGSGPVALRDDAWPAGILGLVASRLVDLTERPVALACAIGDELRGSVRGPADFHVAGALEVCAAHLTKRGGHPGAGGFSLPMAGWEAFTVAFRALPRPFPVDAAITPTRPGRLTVDLVLPARHLGWTFAHEIARLAPFGPGHVEPIVAVTGLTVGDVRRVGAGENHIAFRMRRRAETFDAIAFSMPVDRPLPEVGTAVDLVGTVEIDTFQGQPRLRIRVVDYADAASSPLAVRRAAAVARAASVRSADEQPVAVQLPAGSTPVTAVPGA